MFRCVHERQGGDRSGLGCDFFFTCLRRGVRACDQLGQAFAKALGGCVEQQTGCWCGLTAVRLNVEQIQLVSAGRQFDRRVVGLQGA